MLGSSRSMKRWGTAFAVVLALVVGVMGAPPANAAVPAAPRSLSPTTSSSLATNPVLQWDRVSAASSYNIEVSTTDSFATTIYEVTTTNRRATPTVQLPSGRVWWRVRGVNSNGSGAWASASFDRNVVAGPNLLSPAADVTLAQPAEPPLLSWTAVNGATSYQVEIDGADGDFVDAVAHTTRTTSFVVPTPQENGVYWWRVRALLGSASGSNTLWSDARSYTVGPLPTVGEAAPSNSPDTKVDDVVFDWDPVPGAISYDIRVSPDDSFNSVTMIETRVVKGTRYSPPTTYDNDQYWWQVRARNIFGKAQEWNEVPIRTFRRAWLEAPTLIHPTSTLNPPASDDFYFQWTPVHLATRYRLDVGTDPNWSPGTFESCWTTETTYTAGYTKNPSDACMPAPGVTYYWRVQALDGPRSPQVNGIYSASSKFVYDPGRVAQLAPVQGATVDVPTLTWRPARDAVEYDVKVTWSGGSRTATTKSYSWTPTGTKLDPAKGPFTWTVQSVDHNGDASPLPLFGGETFSLSGNIPTTGAAPLTPLTSPQATATPRFPNLTWEPSDGAAYYKLYVGTKGTGFFDTLPDKFPYPAATDVSATYLQPGEYEWFVSAHTSGGSVIGSPGTHGSFTIADLPSAAGQRVALDGSGLDDGSVCSFFLDDPTDRPKLCSGMRGTPVLDWSPVPDAGYYMVYVSRDREFTNMVYGKKSDPSAIPTTQNTRWNPTAAMPDSQAGDAYYWFIRPCKAPGVCAPDPTSATHAFDKQSNRVDRTSPQDGATVADDVTFTWGDYLDTNKEPAKANQTTGEQSGQAARSYHLQVSTSSAFTTLVDDVTVDQKTYTPFSKTYPEGQLYWRIQAVDGAGNGLAWSTAWGFTKSSDPVMLQAPVGGTTVTSTQPFRWRPLDFAASYDIEVYKDEDRTASSTNRVLSANSKQVAYTTTTPIPASSSAYVWRVRRVDVDGYKGTWSGWGSFKVTGSAPQLVAPSSAVYVSARDSLFTWNAASGATSYKFERRAAGSTSVSESVSTASLAWAPTRLLADGSWQWRVTSLDAAGKALASSAWQGFKVDSTRPRVVAKSPVYRASRTANFVAKFSEPVRNVSGTTMKLYVKGQQHNLSAKVTISADRKTATLNPTNNLKAGKYYTLKLSSAIRDRAGNTLPATSWSATAK